MFSKEFNDYAKNYPLAKAAMQLIPDAKLIEFYGYTREQTVWLYNACDCGLMTSFTEGSPQFIKEAVACGCPIVSTDVGDVKEVIAGIENCAICKYDANDVADKVRRVMTTGHTKNTHLDFKYKNISVANAILYVYKNILNER